MPAWSNHDFIRTPTLPFGAAEVLLLYSSIYVGALVSYGTVKNHDFLLDIVILLQAVEELLWGKGAR